MSDVDDTETIVDFLIPPKLEYYMQTPKPKAIYHIIATTSSKHRSQFLYHSLEHSYFINLSKSILGRSVNAEKHLNGQDIEFRTYAITLTLKNPSPMLFRIITEYLLSNEFREVCLLDYMVVGINHIRYEWVQ